MSKMRARYQVYFLTVLTARISAGTSMNNKAVGKDPSLRCPSEIRVTSLLLFRVG